MRNNFLERVKKLENEIEILKEIIISKPNRIPKYKMNRSALLELFGCWHGEIDDFLRDIYRRRERRGRSE